MMELGMDTCFYRFLRDASQPLATLRLNVPFALSAGTQKFSAGEYTIQEMDSMGLIAIQGEGQAPRR
jgi:hypothetical protein